MSVRPGLLAGRVDGDCEANLDDRLYDSLHEADEDSLHEADEDSLHEADVS